MSQQLRHAAQRGDLKKVIEHLDKGADVDAPHNYSGSTALIEAATAGHQDVVRVLVTRGADINRFDKMLGYTALHFSCDFGPAMAQLLLELGADANAASPHTAMTPLMVAAFNGDELLVQALLDAGAKVNAASMDGNTPLAFARKNKQKKIITLLEKAGATKVKATARSAKLAWPKVDKSGKVCDYSTPESVLRSFILAMNLWELAAAKLDKSRRAEADKERDLLASVNEIFDRYCTPKKRPHGRHGDYQIPPEYDPKEALIDVKLASKTRAELTTRDKDGSEEYLYVLVKKADRWRLDSKKTRIIGSKWMQWFL